MSMDALTFLSILIAYYGIYRAAIYITSKIDRYEALIISQIKKLINKNDDTGFISIAKDDRFKKIAQNIAKFINNDAVSEIINSMLAPVT